MSEARTLREREGLIFERSSAGRIGYQLPPLEVPQADPARRRCASDCCAARSTGFRR